MMERFDGRSILVTGGASGIGEATARAFAAEGGRVTIADLDEERGLAVARSIEAAGGTALFVRADATREEDNIALVETARRAHGPVRHAFNNVGLSRGAGLHELSLEDWEWTVRVSMTSTFLAMKCEVPAMLEIGGGTIVNTSSMSGVIYTSAANAAYSAAKAGVVHLSHYASAHYAARGIRVNSVAPGLTATPIVASFLSAEQQAEVARHSQAIARAVQPEEIAAAVLFLSSDEAAMITGTNMEVNGGRR
jgi:NAD(P)-dependent dehydrogenase (short-subunit alcohol dehydrogenase family)